MLVEGKKILAEEMILEKKIKENYFFVEILKVRNFWKERISEKQLWREMKRELSGGIFVGRNQESLDVVEVN